MGKLYKASVESAPKAPSKKDQAKWAAEDAKWRAQADLDTLMSAAKIKKDKARLEAAMTIAKEKKAELEKVTSEQS